MSGYNYKKLQDLDELFDAYVNHWEGISQSSISAMKRLIDANKTIERVRELHKPSKNGDYCTHCEVGQVSGYDYADYPCETIQALDGER